MLNRSVKSLFPFFGTALMTLILVGCDDAKTANEANFTKALNTYHSNGLCIGENVLHKTTGYTPTDFIYIDDNEKIINSLKEGGIISGVENIGNIKKIDITDHGNSILNERISMGYPFYNFCEGNLTVSKVSKWTEPGKADGQGPVMSEVTYKVQLKNPPSWMTSSDMRQASPEIDQAISGSLEKRAVLVLMNNGWEVAKN